MRPGTSAQRTLRATGYRVSVKQLDTAAAKSALDLKEAIASEWWPTKPPKGKRAITKCKQLYTKLSSEELGHVNTRLVDELGLRWNEEERGYYFNGNQEEGATKGTEEHALITAIKTDMNQAREKESSDAQRGCCGGRAASSVVVDVGVGVDEDDANAKARTKDKLRIELFRVVLAIGQIGEDENAKGGDANTDTIGEWSRYCRDLDRGGAAKNIAAVEDWLTKQLLDNEIDYARKLLELAKKYIKGDSCKDAGRLLFLHCQLAAKFNLPRDLELKCADQLAKVAKEYVSILHTRTSA